MLTEYDRRQQNADLVRRWREEKEAEEKAAERGPHVYLLWDERDTWHPALMGVYATRLAAENARPDNIPDFAIEVEVIQ